MEVVILPDVDGVAAYVSDVFARVVLDRPDAAVGVATGATMVPVYAALARRVAVGEVSLADVRLFLLDEYVGLAPDHPNSYRRFVRDHLLSVTDADPANVDGPRGTAPDVAAECDRYERAITDAGIAVQLLGIGQDGHIGFNEPGSSLGSPTRLKTLSDATCRINAAFFESPDEVPAHVITQGVATILRAHRIVLIATGAAKARPVAQTVEGAITASVPASALQLHPNVTVVLDEDAARDLQQADYYRSVFRRKPEWQRP